MAEKESTIVVPSGTPWVSLLGVAFVVLKLCNVISWSWWWVTAPFWIIPAFVISISVVGVVVIGSFNFLYKRFTR